jgi:hypothetical protein
LLIIPIFLTSTIYLSQEYLLINEQNPEIITEVLLEEIRHFVDSNINVVDAEGDEGAIFSALVLGETLNNSQLQQLRDENDTDYIVTDIQQVNVEKK